MVFVWPLRDKQINEQCKTTQQTKLLQRLDVVILCSCKVPYFSFQFSVFSLQLSVVSCQLSVVSFQFSVVSFQLSVSGGWGLPARHEDTGDWDWSMAVLGFG